MKVFLSKYLGMTFTLKNSDIMKCVRFFFVLATMTLFVNCTFENHKANKYICFEELDTHIQDTLRNLVIDTLGCYPDLIDLVGHYNLKTKKIGPWIYAQKIENLKTGKSYWFDYNTPRPFIVTSKGILFPMKYNIITKKIDNRDELIFVKFN